MEEILSLANSSNCKGDDVDRMCEVNEGVAHVAFIVEVDSEIHEIVSSEGRHVKHHLHSCLINTVWDVSNHYLRGCQRS